MIDLNIVFAIGGAAIAGAPSVLLHRANKRKTQAEAEHTYTSAAADLSHAAVELVGPYRTALDELRVELTDAHKTVAELHTEAERLRTELTTSRAVIKALTDQLREARKELRRVRIELARLT